MEDILTVVVDSRLRLQQKIPRDFAKALKAEFTYSNPDYYRKQSMGFSTWGDKTVIKTFELVEPAEGKGKLITLPRGGTNRLRAVAAAHGYRIRWRDRSTDASAEFPRFCVNPDHPELELRWYQDQAVELASKKRQGVIRAPTGSGKTIAAFALIHRIERRTMVIMRDGNLLNQWKAEAQKCLGLSKKQIGLIKGGVKYWPGRPLVLALQQSLWKMGPERLAELFRTDPFGMVLIDECFDSQSMILMEDGTKRPISDIRKGDVVAVGGVVTATISRQYEGPMFEVGDAYSTSDHPVGTSRGWVTASSISDDDVLWYDDKHDEREIVRSVRVENEISMSGSDTSKMRPSGVQVIRGVFGLRGDRGSSEEGCACDDMPKRVGLEQGADEIYERSCNEECSISKRASNAGAREGSIEKIQGNGIVQRSVFQGAVEEIRSGVGKGSFQDQDAGIDQIGEGEALRGEGAWKRGGSDNCGSGVVEEVGPNGVCSRVCGCDKWGISSELVQDRFCSFGIENSSGARRAKPRPFEGEEGQIEGLFPRVSDVAGIEIQGGRLRQDRIRNIGGGDAIASCKVYNLETETGAYIAGGVLVHNCQTLAARTFMGVVDHIPTRYRIGVSADETRKDRKEFLTYDAMGDVIYEIEREALESEGVIHPVKVRVIPTDFTADWYVSADSGDRDFSRLIQEMTEDQDRNDLILNLAEAILAADEVPALMFTHRREHAYGLADAELSVRMGIPCGLLLGGSGVDRERFNSDSKRLMSGSLKMAMGTFNSLGVGINLPAIRAGIVTTPISGKNPQFFNQVRGRICRTSEDSGKRSAVLYYVWDQAVFPRQLQNLRKWNRGNVEILRGGKWALSDRG